MGIGWTEIIVILVVALVFLGPSRFPAAARRLGSYYRELRDALSTMENEFERAVDPEHTPDQTTMDTGQKDCDPADEPQGAGAVAPAVQADDATGNPMADNDKPR